MKSKTQIIRFVVAAVAVFASVTSVYAQGSAGSAQGSSAPAAGELGGFPNGAADGSGAPVAAAKPSPEPAAADLRKICSDALNADPEFEKSFLRVVDEKRAVAAAETEQQRANIHIKAGDEIAKNNKHVIMAYAVMWLAAVGFLLFLWQRQRKLRESIAKLQAELTAALKENP